MSQCANRLGFTALASLAALIQKCLMEKYDAVISALPDPALVVSDDLVVASCNEAMRKYLDTDPVGSHLTNYFRAPSVMQAAKEALQSGENSNVEFATKGQQSRSYDVFVSAFKTGESQKVLLILRDSTYQRQIERMRSDFVANASHELRTPLTALAGFIETMQGAAKLDSAAREQFLGLMKVQADRMSRLTDDLLSLSHIEINEHVRPAGRVLVYSLIEQCADLLSDVAAAGGCTINAAIDKKLAVAGDADQLLQVFQNLMENALKYGAKGKRIDITAHHANNYTDVVISDYGAGIAAHHIPRLTERFYRVDVKDSRAHGGTGLGLAIVKHILNRHGGKLIIESELGKGSTFTVRLPSE